MPTSNPVPGEFLNWLRGELDSRRWQPKDLSDATGISFSQVMYVLNAERTPGIRFLRGLARAFDMPQESVFRLAGVLTDEEAEDVKEDETARKIRRLLATLEPDEQDKAIHLLETYVRDHKRAAPGARAARGQA